MSSKNLSTAVVLSLLFGSAVLGMPLSDVTNTPALQGNKPDLSKPSSQTNPSSSSNLQVPGSVGLSSQTPSKLPGKTNPELSSTPKSTVEKHPNSRGSSKSLEQERRRPGDEKEHRRPEDERERRRPGDERERRRPGDEKERRRPGDEKERRRPGDEKEHRRPGDEREPTRHRRPGESLAESHEREKKTTNKHTDRDDDDRQSKLSDKHKSSSKTPASSNLRGESSPLSQSGSSSSSKKPVDTKLQGAANPLSQSGSSSSSKKPVDTKLQGAASPLSQSGNLSPASQTSTKSKPSSGLVKRDGRESRDGEFQKPKGGRRKSQRRKKVQEEASNEE